MTEYCLSGLALTKFQTIEGRRITYVVRFVHKLKALSGHAPQFGCTLINMDLTKEVKRAPVSGFVLRCNIYRLEESLWSKLLNS